MKPYQYSTRNGAKLDTIIEKIEAKRYYALRDFRAFSIFGWILCTVVWIFAIFLSIVNAYACSVVIIPTLMSIHEVREWRWYKREMDEFNADLAKRLERE